jgi:3-oxoacyl-[acyl-carrier protein] reductase
MMAGRFADRTVVVTGASRGLGRAMAAAFAAEGAYVFVCYRQAVDEAAKSVSTLGGRGEPLQFDVTRPEEVHAAFVKVHQRRGLVDVLVNNAGSSQDAPAVLLGPAQWREVLAVNLDGAFFCTREVLAPMLHARRGAIVNIASAAALRANPGQANYAASKGGLLALSRTLAAELGPKGIRVNAVVPGLINAGMAQHLDRRVVEQWKARIALGRLGFAEDVAHAVLFLASDDAAYITGCELPVDGGLTL